MDPCRVPALSSLNIFILLIFGSLFIYEAESKLKIQIKMLVSSNTLNPKNFKPGVSIDPQPDSIVYNKFIPLVFQLKVPDFSSDSLKLNTSLHCTTDSITPNFYCPVAYHFDRLLSPLADNMRFSKNIYTPVEGWPYFGQIRCNIIEPHFQHISAHINELHLYTDKLMSECPLAKNLTIVQKNITSGASSHITMASTRFATALSNNKDFNNDEYNLIHMAGYIGLQANYILTKYIDTIRWTNAFTSCQSYKLNINLIHSYLLQTSLASVKSIAEENGLKLSIPSHEHLPHYYKLPITDCILGVQNSKKSTLMIRVSVPVMKTETKYTRIRMTKIPYLVSEKEGEVKKICEIDGFEASEEFLLEESIDGKHLPFISSVTDCFEGELCYVPEHPRRPTVDQCLRGLINGSVEDIRDFCSFSCYELENADIVLPMIIKVDSNHYSITGAPPNKTVNGKVEKLQVFCDNVLNQDLSPNATNGVLQVVLPCNCEIRYKSNVYKASKPCDGPLETHYLRTIPFHAIYMSGEEAQLLGLMDDANQTTNGTAEIGEEDLDGPIAASAMRSTDHEHAKCPSHSGQIGFIWVFIVFLLLSNFLLIYVAHCNRLIHFELLTGMLSRWGFGTTTPISRLREDPVVMSQQQQNQNHLDNYTQPPWPNAPNLNRL